MTQRIAIFGATSAIAAEVARVYAARGARLYLVGRNGEKLAAIAAELPGSVAGSAIQDFDDTAAADSCVRAAVETLGGIDLGLIAHGLIGDQLESEAQLAEAERIARTNYLSVIALLIPLANQLESQRQGQLAVISTVAAERGRPRNYSYAAAKAALNVYLQGLRSRLYQAGVGVTTIKLGPVDTPMTTEHRKNLLFSRSQRVGVEIAQAIDRGSAEAFVPGYWRLIMFAVRNMPEAIFQRIPALVGR
jgi:decaprenylphospho-beta-D-erythro-pentofuranosid-2-ulose 2-reductase